MTYGAFGYPSFYGKGYYPYGKSYPYGKTYPFGKSYPFGKGFYW